jgi:hypothetical protein
MNNNNYLTEETLEEGRIALIHLERQLKQRGTSLTNPNDFSNNSFAEQNQYKNKNSVNNSNTGTSKLLNQPSIQQKSSRQFIPNKSLPYSLPQENLATLSSANNVLPSNMSNVNRKMLDQIPRGARLTQRLESLGLTVEELEDRGLLEGGGSLPSSQYSSTMSRSRRSLELQPRSHRLQERGKESLSKVLGGLGHMLRCLHRRGLDLAALGPPATPRHYRKGGAGQLMPSKQFVRLLRSLNLPLSQREVGEVALYYAASPPTPTPTPTSAPASAPASSAAAAPSGGGARGRGHHSASADTTNSGSGSSDMVDYFALLRDARVISRPTASSRAGGKSEHEDDYEDAFIDDDLNRADNNSYYEPLPLDPSSFTKVLADVKAMLCDATKQLGYIFYLFCILL